MKRLTALVIALVVIFGTAGCSNIFLHPIKKAVKIEIIQYERHSSDDEPRTATITNTECIRHICDNLNSLKLKKIEYGEPIKHEFQLVFYDAGGKELETVYITFGNGIIVGIDYYAILGGELDRDYIAGLV